MSGLGRGLARAAVGAAGAALGLRLGARSARFVGPLEMRAELDLGRGGVDVEIPPLGTAHLRTHRGPLTLRTTAVGLDLDRAEALLDGRSPSVGKNTTSTGDLAAAGDAAQAAVRADAMPLARTLAIRATVSGLAGAAALAAVAFRRPRDVVASTAAAAVALAAAAGRAATSIDKDAWRDPHLDGLLTRAPLVLGELRTAPQRIGTYRDQLAELVATATDVYRHIDGLPEEPPADAVRLVHVSDLHLSPLGLPLAKVLIERYNADAVVDTGDLVDWGTPAEDAFANQIAGLRVPYLFIKGNHDSQSTVRAVARQPNATVLDADPVEVAGLRFAGLSDPRFTPDKTTGDDTASHRSGEAGTKFAEQLRGKNVDIALVHSPAAGRPLAGVVPLVLAGDIHRRDVRVAKGTTILVQGTTGGSGLRGVQKDPPTPLDLSVLYIDRATRRLWGADEITVGGLGSTTVSVVRRTARELTAG